MEGMGWMIITLRLRNGEFEERRKRAYVRQDALIVNSFGCNFDLASLRPIYFLSFSCEV